MSEYLDSTGLALYDEQIKAYISSVSENSAGVKIVTLTSAPTSSTTTYTIGTTTYAFKIGDEARVADQNEETGYKFYQLKDLNNGTAAWEETGKGSSGPVYNPITRSIDFPAGYNISYDEANRTIIIN